METRGDLPESPENQNSCGSKRFSAHLLPRFPELKIREALFPLLHRGHPADWHALVAPRPPVRHRSLTLWWSDQEI